MRIVDRPDGRRWLVTAEPDEALPPGDLYVTVDESDGEALSRYERLGFARHRRELVYAVPTDPGRTGLQDARPPHGVTFAPADEVDEDRLRLLDDALRQEVPGTDGWRWDEPGFREETYESPAFDPATYAVAIDETTGDYVGIARVWHNPRGARLGFIGVLPACRRRGIARALLAHVFGVLHARGQAEVSTEVDEQNVASRSLIESLGARRTGSTLELIRRDPAKG